MLAMNLHEPHVRVQSFCLLKEKSRLADDSHDGIPPVFSVRPSGKRAMSFPPRVCP